MNKNVRQIALYLLIIAALAFFVATFGNSPHPTAALTYTQVNALLDQGRVIATGGHADLLATCPTYQKLWNAQTQRLAA